MPAYSFPVLPTSSSEYLRQSIVNSLRDGEASHEEIVQSPVWRPLPGPQTHALLTEAFELFYGGAAGGGKTDLLIGAALTQHQKSLILRRESAQLQAIKDRSREIILSDIHSKATFNDNTGVWRNLPGGRTIKFGGLKDLGDERNYQGQAHDFKGFDELPEILEAQYTFVIGWTRTATPGQRTRVMGAGNPPTTAEGEWVITRWGAWLDTQHPNPASPGELRWYAMLDGKYVEVEDEKPFEHKGEIITPKSRTFIPASVQDNPYYLATGYIATLQATPEPLRSQLLYGDFNVGREDDPYQVIPTTTIRDAQKRWIAAANTGQQNHPITAIGVDVARGGKDKTVLCILRGDWAEFLVYDGRDTTSGQAIIALLMPYLSAGVPVNVDVIGVGASVYDQLRPIHEDTFPINFAARSHYRDKSGRIKAVNIRAEAYWNVREALSPENGRELCLPPDTQLTADLSAPRYQVRGGGLVIESKEEIKKRIGRSTDRGDALALALLIRTGAISISPGIASLPDDALRSNAPSLSEGLPKPNEVIMPDEDGRMIVTARDRMHRRRR